MSEIIAQAIEIIAATEDGDRLHPHDLNMVEMAVNGFVNDAGRAAFAQLYQDVSAGCYVSPWDVPYFGIEELRIDAAGFVYWRGVRVEHYTPGWCWGEAARAAAEALAALCRRYEAEGRAVTPGIVWEN